MSKEMNQIIQILLDNKTKYDLTVLDKIISIQMTKIESYDSPTEIELALSNLIELLKIRQEFAFNEDASSELSEF